MEGFCRACLIKFNDPTVLLQYTEKNRRLFVYSTGLQVKHNEAFTFLLCKECYLNMKLSCKFKKQCRTSDKRFKNYLALKDIGDNIDFCTFLKNNDDTLGFRLPILSGNSTPANQKCRDDDNESTCTSIRNFMSDILQGEEVLDTEARIIREVIEEEADLLDDSLDSHWLQEDISIDTDFRLDLSLSPFSTPRSINEDHCYTPKKVIDLREQYNQLNYFTSKKILENTDDNKNKGEEVFNELLPIENVANHTEYANGISLDSNNTKNNGNLKEDNDLIEYVDLIDSRELEGKNALNYYIEDIAIIEQTDTTTEKNKDINVRDNVTIQNNKCSIDKNLEEALKNKANQAFSLDELLLSPPVFPNVSAPTTPTISNILFGEKIDIDGENSTTGQNIERYDNVEGDVDILEDFFKNDTVVLNEEASIINEPADIVDREYKTDTTKDRKHTDIYNLDTLFCLACKKQFKSAKALKKHLTSKHDITLKKSNSYSTKVCNECGKAFAGRANLHRHLKTHEKKPQKSAEIFQCEHCPIECVSLAILKMHMKAHTGSYVGKDTGRKYVCNICNAVSTTPGNFNIHMRRHTKSYTHFCKVCGKGFYRASDLKTHAKIHNNSITLKCKHCSLEYDSLARLNLHMKSHGTKVKKESAGNYICTICGAVSTTLGNFNIHQRRHTKSYTHHCEECGKGFYTSFELKEHMRRHTGTRPFKCPHCDRKFTRRNTLVNHLKCHTDEKRFDCDYCKKSFVRKATLVMHLKMSKSCFESRTMLPYNTRFKFDSENSFEYSPKTEEDNNYEYLSNNEEDDNSQYLYHGETDIDAQSLGHGEEEINDQYLNHNEAQNDGQYLDPSEEEYGGQYMDHEQAQNNSEYLNHDQAENDIF